MAKSLSENYEGCCFRGKGRMARRDEGEYPLIFDRGATKPGGLLPLAWVGSAITARCGDALASPPWPETKSLAAAPLVVFRQALTGARPLALRNAPQHPGHFLEERRLARV